MVLDFTNNRSSAISSMSGDIGDSINNGIKAKFSLKTKNNKMLAESKNPDFAKFKTNVIAKTDFLIFEA